MMLEVTTGGSPPESASSTEHQAGENPVGISSSGNKEAGNRNGESNLVTGNVNTRSFLSCDDSPEGPRGSVCVAGRDRAGDEQSEIGPDGTPEGDEFMKNQELGDMKRSSNAELHLESQQAEEETEKNRLVEVENMVVDQENEQVAQTSNSCEDGKERESFSRENELEVGSNRLKSAPSATVGAGGDDEPLEAESENMERLETSYTSLRDNGVEPTLQFRQVG